MAELSIPQQRRSGRATCASCGEPIHLAHRQLGALWTHGDTHGSEWCGSPLDPPTTLATPAGVGVRHG